MLDFESNTEFPSIDATLVLDGQVDVAGVGLVPWGAVVLDKPMHSAYAASADARVCQTRLPPQAQLSRAFAGTPLVLRDPRLFVGLLTAACGSAAVVELAHAAPSAARFVEGRGGRHWLDTARDLLHEGFDRSLRMRDIARTVGVHPVHVSRGFARRYNVTMTQYVRDLRLIRAADLLLGTSQPLSRIALATGFADHAHFTRVFVSCIGLTPSAVRRRASAREAA